jgi:hypothetical protein
MQVHSVSHILTGLTRKRFLFLAIIAILSAACGATGISPASNPTPTPSQGVMGFDVTATNTDRAVTMHVGQKLEVALRAGQGMNDWSHPASSDESVLAPTVDPAATAARGVTLAAFEAKKAGEVTVTSNSGPACSPGQACPMYLAVYSLKVTVTP